MNFMFLVILPVVSKAAEVVNKKLLEVLLNKYKLYEHFQAIKRYLLLGQGDFIQYLMDLLGYYISWRF